MEHPCHSALPSPYTVPLLSCFSHGECGERLIPFSVFPLLVHHLLGQHAFIFSFCFTWNSSSWHLLFLFAFVMPLFLTVLIFFAIVKTNQRCVPN